MQGVLCLSDIWPEVLLFKGIRNLTQYLEKGSQTEL